MEHYSLCICIIASQSITEAVLVQRKVSKSKSCYSGNTNILSETGMAKTGCYECNEEAPGGQECQGPDSLA